MPGPDETNELLREIRDLLASQESRHEVHRAETKKLYEDQLARMKAMERRRLVAAAIFMACLFALAVFSR